MAEFIPNPRRAPRAPARCRVAVLSAQGRFEADTEDIGSLGCQIVLPRHVRKGEPIRLVVTNPKLDESLDVTGRIAWASAQAPWRIGVAFDDDSLADSARWFERLITAYPGLGGYRRVPERIRTDAMVYLGPPPRFLLDFTADEAMLLRAIASGARVDELMARLRDGWPAAQRALFSLIARQAVTLQRGQAVHPDSWKNILHDVEASLAVESLGSTAPEVAASSAPLARAPEAPAPRAPAPAQSAAASGAATHGSATPPPMARPGATPLPARSGLSLGAGWAGGQAHDPTRVVQLQQDDAAPLEIAPSAGAGPPASRNAPVGQAIHRDHVGAGVGWRKAAHRSADAQAAFERALVELRASNISGALSFLRLALSLAPGDAEIAQEIGKLAFKDRLPGSG
jgi:hypothetical protein